MLKTVDGVLCQSYQEACLWRGLLEDDQHWHDCLEEAVVCQSSLKIRELFAIVTKCCHPSEPKVLWDQYKNWMAEDILFQAQRQLIDCLLQYTPAMYNQALILLEDKVLQMTGLHLPDFHVQSPQ
ncbi:uncharacterized protein LOC136085276 [Hydra vulgaris]|uniref:Uncharacterized protein LOC136085276 n=1 Tax=Hydra vulgaris TaxID=6087 RepID=A0ABM4CLH1_HYDVU